MQIHLTGDVCVCVTSLIELENLLIAITLAGELAATAQLFLRNAHFLRNQYNSASWVWLKWIVSAYSSDTPEVRSSDR